MCKRRRTQRSSFRLQTGLGLTWGHDDTAADQNCRSERRKSPQKDHLSQLLARVQDLGGGGVVVKATAMADGRKKHFSVGRYLCTHSSEQLVQMGETFNSNECLLTAITASLAAQRLTSMKKQAPFTKTISFVHTLFISWGQYIGFFFKKTHDL